MQITIFTLIGMIRLIGFNIQDIQIHVNIHNMISNNLFSIVIARMYKSGSKGILAFFGFLINVVSKHIVGCAMSLICIPLIIFLIDMLYYEFRKHTNLNISY